MPEISLLKPTVLNGVIETLTAPQELQGIRLLPREPHPFPTVVYDTIRGSRLLATPNVPNSEAHIAPKLGIGQLTAGYLYVREKKVFEPTTMYWLRQPGTLAQKRAEAAVIREVQDLSDRVDRFMEYCIWRGMFTGSLVINEADVKVNVNFGIANTHKPVLASTDKWDYTSGTNPVSGLTNYIAPIRDQVNAWKRLVSRDGMANLNTAYMNAYTADIMMRNTVFTGNMISDRQKDEFLRTNSIPGLWGIDWNVYDLAYESGGSVIPFIPDGVVVFFASEGRPFEMLEGPSADFGAPPDSTGRFTKTWQEEDPSARQALIEENFFPALYKPDQVIYAKVF